MQKAIDETSFERNYTVYIYEVIPQKILTISSLTIGAIDTITRYAFFEDNNAQNLIKSGSLNHAGWSDNYEDKVLVPPEANYLLVTCQNGGLPKVYYNNDIEICEELNHCDKLYNHVIDSKGSINGLEIDEGYRNYTIYIYELPKVKTIQITTAAKGNTNTLMRYAFSNDKKGDYIEKNGILNSEGWNDEKTTNVHLQGDEKYLLVTCQNGTEPSVIAIN